MSKAFALAGARLGYLAAAPAICDALRVVRLPYHLSAVTQATALAALRHAPELLGKVDDLRAERDATVAWLREQGLRWPTATPTSCCSALRRPARGLAGSAGPRGADPGDRSATDGCASRSAPPQEMAAFREALAEVMETRQESRT